MDDQLVDRGRPDTNTTIYHSDDQTKKGTEARGFSALASHATEARDSPTSDMVPLRARSAPTVGQRPDFEREVLDRLKQLEVEVISCHRLVCQKIDYMYNANDGDGRFSRQRSKERTSRRPSRMYTQVQPPRDADWGAAESSPQPPTIADALMNIRSREATPRRSESKTSVTGGRRTSAEVFELQREIAGGPPPNIAVTLAERGPSKGTAWSSHSEISEDTHDTASKKPTGILSRRSATTESLKNTAASRFFNRYKKRNEFAQKAWDFLDDPESSHAAMVYDTVLPFLLLAAVLVTIMQTIDPPVAEVALFNMFELVIEIFFSFELTVRYYASPNRGMQFIRKPFNFIDVLASLPLVVRIVVMIFSTEKANEEIMFICSVAVIRLLKMMRRFQKIHLLFGAFHLAFEALPVLIYSLVMITLFFASLVFLVESETFGSLPVAMWFTIVTMTTVGYGNIVPVTWEGTLIVSALVICSVLYMAMPLGIVGHAFTQVWEDRDRILLVKKTQAALQQWGYTARDIPVLFEIFDSKGEGELNIKDFRKMIHQMRIGLNDHRINELFHRIDDDGGGTIDDKELVRAIFPDALHDLYGDDVGETETESCTYCSCGSKLRPDMQFCGKCGKAVMEEEEPHLTVPGGNGKNVREEHGSPGKPKKSINEHQDTYCGVSW